MTLQIDKLIKAIPGSKTLEEARAKSGAYTKGARSIYRKHTKLHIAEALDFKPEVTKAKIIKFQAKCIKDNDNSNYSRMIELEARISVPELRKQEITHTNPDKIVIQYIKPSTTGSIEPKTEENPL